jgi:hypothetical protein
LTVAHSVGERAGSKVGRLVGYEEGKMGDQMVGNLAG